MKILLDECVPQRLRNHFPGHECQSAQYAGFAGLESGDLLRAAEAAKFDVLLTVDRGFEYEQNLGRRQIAILILSTGQFAWKTCCRTSRTLWLHLSLEFPRKPVVNDLS